MESIYIHPDIQTLLSQSRKTDYSGIYCNKRPFVSKDKPFLIILTGPSGSGKTTFRDALSGTVQYATTATSRSRRDGEPEEAYIWMSPPRGEAEDIEAYRTLLVKKYELLESNEHAGNIYGLPKSSLEASLAKGDTLVAIENNGARALSELLVDKANIIVFFILPDNYEQLRERIGSSRNELERRLQIAEKEITTSQEVTHYYLHNTASNLYSGQEDEPLKRTTQSIQTCIASLRRFISIC
ncbi:MAG: hypothetical protein ACOCXT_06640 [Candidatus Dojkabacteria bacterium]